MSKSSLAVTIARTSGSMIGLILTLPVHLIAIPIHSIITVKPENYHKTTGKVIHNMGMGLGKITGSLAESIEKKNNERG